MRRILLFLTAFCVVLDSQSFQGTFRGRVTDSNDAILPLAKVTIVEEATSVTSSTLANQQGEFSFPAIKPTTYTLIVEAPGFKKMEQHGIVVATQSTVTQDVALEIGQVNETVNVSAEATPLIETAEASTGQVLDREKIEDLPNLGRNPFILARLSEAVVWTGNPKFVGWKTKADPPKSPLPADRRRRIITRWTASQSRIQRIALLSSRPRKRSKK